MGKIHIEEKKLYSALAGWSLDPVSGDDTVSELAEGAVCLQEKLQQMLALHLYIRNIYIVFQTYNVYSNRQDLQQDLI